MSLRDSQEFGRSGHISCPNTLENVNSSLDHLSKEVLRCQNPLVLFVTLQGVGFLIEYLLEIIVKIYILKQKGVPQISGFETSM